MNVRSSNLRYLPLSRPSAFILLGSFSSANNSIRGNGIALTNKSDIPPNFGDISKGKTRTTSNVCKQTASLVIYHLRGKKSSSASTVSWSTAFPAK